MYYILGSKAVIIGVNNYF